jgi:16S rRNA (cytosine1402-N4)-methyltransferase
LGELGIGRVDGVLFDFGVSSMQLDQPERGFSFQIDGPLDMRMDASGGMTAYDLLSSLEERELAEILHSYGEEPSARRIARAIIAARKRGELPERTGALARMVAGVVHRPGHRERTHPATRTFQALRIAVNDELHSIERGLAGAIDVTRVGGRIAAISFHSLEDRIVKQTFRSDSRMNVLTKKPIGPGADEILRNPRSRSAKLRVAERAV